MSQLHWLSEEQLGRARLFFQKERSAGLVDDIDSERQNLCHRQRLQSEGIPLKSVVPSKPCTIGADDGLKTAFLDVAVKICKA